MSVTHDRVHCHWRWQCYFSLLASFEIWINASLPNNAILWLPGDHFPFWNFTHQGTCNFSSWSWGSFGCIWHELMDVWASIWLWWGRTFRICSIAVRFASKSEVDMLKMWVHERTTAENNSVSHCQSKFWYLTMITKTIEMQFWCVMFNNN